MLGERAGLRDPVTLHNFYVPAGGDIPDAEVNPKFAHKLSFLDEMRDCAKIHPTGADRSILVGDLNVAPLESDVWSHKQMIKAVSHTPLECEKLNAVQKAGNWIDVARTFVPEPEESSTRGGAIRLAHRRQGPPPGPHLGVAPGLGDRLASA